MCHFIKALSLLCCLSEKFWKVHHTIATCIFCSASVALECFSQRMWRTFTAVAAFKPPLPCRWNSRLTATPNPPHVAHFRCLICRVICLRCSFAFLVVRTLCARAFRHDEECGYCEFDESIPNSCRLLPRPKRLGSRHFPCS